MAGMMNTNEKPCPVRLYGMMGRGPNNIVIREDIWAASAAGARAIMKLRHPGITDVAVLYQQRW